MWTACRWSVSTDSMKMLLQLWLLDGDRAGRAHDDDYDEILDVTDIRAGNGNGFRRNQLGK